MADQKRKPGTPSRGARTTITVRVTEDDFAILERRAADLGIPIGSYVYHAAIKVENLETPEYLQKELDRALKRKEQAEQEAPVRKTA